MPELVESCFIECVLLFSLRDTRDHEGAGSERQSYGSLTGIMWAGRGQSHEVGSMQHAATIVSLLSDTKLCPAYSFLGLSASGEPLV